MAESASSHLPETKTPIIEKRLFSRQERMPMTLRDPLLGPKTPAAKDRLSAGQERSKYNPIK